MSVNMVHGRDHEIGTSQGIMQLDNRVLSLSRLTVAMRSRMANHSGRIFVVDLLIVYATFRSCQRNKFIY